MAEIDKSILEENDVPEEKDIDIELEGEEEQTFEEAASESEEFYKNIAEDLSDDVLQRMSNQLLDDYKKDRVSRKDWETSYTNNLDLLGIKHTEMTRPFKGSASVTHPLLSEAVTQFQAQAYKELLPSQGPVRTRVLGVEDNEKINQAQRVQDFMNYMITEEMEEYTPEFDQLLFYLALAGSAFKKVYYDEVMQRAVSKFIPAEELVVPYYASDLMECERITHVIKMGENEILKKQASGFYRDIELKPTSAGPTQIEKKYQELEGVTPSTDKQYSYSVLEMHVDCNLEEFEMQNPEKQVKVPYIITIDEGSGEVLSIYRNYDIMDENKKRKEYFVHFKFLPGLGFYGFGLTHMIGGLSRTATQALRQLLDAGTLSNLPAGFKSRGIRIRDDDQPFQPGEFRDVDAPGGNIKDQFQILPFKEPSATLYQLMGFVVQAGQKFAAITNMDTGNDSQNRSVGTTVAMLERGSRVMTAIHKRCYYSMRREFRLLSKVFGTYLPPIYPYAVYGADQAVKRTDFDDRVDVIPVADPNIMSMSQRVTLANENLKIAMSNPQMHNLREAYRRVYEALGTQDIDQLLVPQEKPIPKDPATENMESLMQKPLKAFPDQDHDAHITAHVAFMQTRMVQINPQVYSALQAHISEHVSLKAQGEVGAMVQEDPNVQQMLQQDPQAAQIRMASMIARRVAEITTELAKSESMGQQKDPLVALKERELDLKAVDLQRKAEQDMNGNEIRENEMDEKIDLEKMKLENNEDQAAERIRIAEEKLEIARQRKRNENKN
tara:strand:- start:1702 stop:4038 length:2337 start_codon:yes stop_codon:yes gene_type:complete